MKDYMQLISETWKLNRVHISDEMFLAYKKVQEFYQGSELIQYPSGKEFGGKGSWTIPQKWVIRKAELKNSDGKLICSYEETPLRVFAYSPPFKGKISKQELETHIFTNPKQPDVIPFHFRNQYRPWERQWGFCLTHNEFKALSDNNYYVDIQTEFVSDKMTQLEYEKKGVSKQRYLFVGHFDHPAMCNDGLAGCIVANEVIRRLQSQETHYSYASLNSVEILGSVAYCEFEKEKIANTKEALFVAMSGSKTPFAYQYSSQPQNSLFDRAITHLLKIRYDNTTIKPFRELVGNDECAFEAPGVNIRCGSISRWPYQQYHTSEDNFDLLDEECMEEKIHILLDTIYIIENNFKIKAQFSGLPCLSNPKLDLYLSPTLISQIEVNSLEQDKYYQKLNKTDKEYIKKNAYLLNNFMNKLIAILSDLDHSYPELDVLEIAEISILPFPFVLNYLKLMQEKELILLQR